MGLKDVITNWVELFNKADALRISDLYHEEATNHQMPNIKIVGRENIKKMFENEFDNAEMVCIPVNIFVDGDTAILE